MVKKSVHYTQVNMVVKKYDFRRRVNQVSEKNLQNVSGLMINMLTDLLSVYISLMHDWHVTHLVVDILTDLCHPTYQTRIGQYVKQQLADWNMLKLTCQPTRQLCIGQ